MLSIEEWKAVIEGALFLAGDEGVSLQSLSKMIDMQEDTVQCFLDELAIDYLDNQRGLMLSQMGTHYYLTTKKEHASFYQKLFLSSSQQVLSQAALETLAIIAYKQPITRVEIEEIRGVKTERPIQSLIAKCFVKPTGRSDAIGRPYLYGTTKEFLQYFGLKSLEELPELNEMIDEDEERDLFLSNIHQGEKT